jgi:hypothetical protein
LRTAATACVATAAVTLGPSEELPASQHAAAPFQQSAPRRRSPSIGGTDSANAEPHLASEIHISDVEKELLAAESERHLASGSHINNISSTRRPNSGFAGSSTDVRWSPPLPELPAQERTTAGAQLATAQHVCTADEWLLVDTELETLLALNKNIKVPQNQVWWHNAYQLTKSFKSTRPDSLGTALAEVDQGTGRCVINLCDNSHFRAMLGCNKVWWLFDSLNLFGGFNMVSKCLKQFYPEHRFKRIEMRPQSDAVNCGMWVQWVVEIWSECTTEEADLFGSYLIQQAILAGVSDLGESPCTMKHTQQAQMNRLFIQQRKTEFRRDVIPRAMCPLQERTLRRQANTALGPVDRLALGGTRDLAMALDGTDESHVGGGGKRKGSLQQTASSNALQHGPSASASSHEPIPSHRPQAATANARRAPTKPATLSIREKCDLIPVSAWRTLGSPLALVCSELVHTIKKTLVYKALVANVVVVRPQPSQQFVVREGIARVAGYLVMHLRTACKRDPQLLQVLRSFQGQMQPNTADYVLEYDDMKRFSLHSATNHLLDHLTLVEKKRQTLMSERSLFLGRHMALKLSIDRLRCDASLFLDFVRTLNLAGVVIVGAPKPPQEQGDADPVAHPRAALPRPAPAPAAPHAAAAAQPAAAATVAALASTSSSAAARLGPASSSAAAQLGPAAAAAAAQPAAAATVAAPGSAASSAAAQLGPASSSAAAQLGPAPAPAAPPPMPPQEQRDADPTASTQLVRTFS